MVYQSCQVPIAKNRRLLEEEMHCANRKGNISYLAVEPFVTTTRHIVGPNPFNLKHSSFVLIISS